MGEILIVNPTVRVRRPAFKPYIWRNAAGYPPVGDRQCEVLDKIVQGQTSIDPRLRRFTPGDEPMRFATWLLVCASGLMLVGCNIQGVFISNRGLQLATLELSELMTSVSRTSVSAQFGPLSDVQVMGLSSALSSTRLSCAPDSTGVSDRNSLGVPVDLTYSWTVGRCLTGPGSTQQTLSGVTRTQDLGGRFGVRFTHENLVGTVTSPGAFQRISARGFAEIRATDATTAEVVQRITEITELASAAESGIITRIRNVTLTLVDTLGVPNTSSRPGRRADRLSVNGSYISVVNGAIRDSTHLMVSTIVPLESDVTCVSGYRAGEIRAVVSGIVDDVITMTYRCQ